MMKNLTFLPRLSWAYVWANAIISAIESLVHAIGTMLATQELTASENETAEPETCRDLETS
jgi:hypothetical protein